MLKFDKKNEMLIVKINIYLGTTTKASKIVLLHKRRETYLRAEAKISSSGNPASVLCASPNNLSPSLLLCLTIGVGDSFIDDQILIEK